MTILMLGASGLGASVQPQQSGVADSFPALRRRRAHRPAPPQPKGGGVALRCGILAALMLAYQGSFSRLHELIGNPSFLVGLGICLVAAAWLGVRGALVVIGCIALIDRSICLNLPPSLETGRIASLIALLVRLVLAGGLGMVVDSRRRALALNAELRREMEARQHSEESL